MMSGKILSVVLAGLAAMCISQGVFAQAATATPAARPEQAAAAAQVDATFKAWDADHNGALSAQEFKTGWAAMRQVAEVEARLRAQFHKVDANGNGAIDAAEYANLVLVKNAGKSAPLLSAFDTNKNQRLEFGEYLGLVRRMSQPVAPAVHPSR